MASITCSRCHKRLRFGDKFAARRAKCPKCGKVLDLPQDSASSAALADPGTDASICQQEFVRDSHELVEIVCTSIKNSEITAMLQSQEAERVKRDGYYKLPDFSPSGYVSHYYRRI